MPQIKSLVEQLIRDEDFKQFPYRDSVGKLTIGIGRNLEDVGISWDEGLFLCNNDIKYCEEQLTKAYPWTEGMDSVRRAALLNMTFNMGIHRLSGFKQALKYAQQGLYGEASHQMLLSKWATQVGARAQRLAIQMESGEFQ